MFVNNRTLSRGGILLTLTLVRLPEITLNTFITSTNYYLNQTLTKLLVNGCCQKEREARGGGYLQTMQLIILILLCMYDENLFLLSLYCKRCKTVLQMYKRKFPTIVLCIVLILTSGSGSGLNLSKGSGSIALTSTVHCTVYTPYSALAWYIKYLLTQRNLMKSFNNSRTVKEVSKDVELIFSDPWVKNFFFLLFSAYKLYFQGELINT